MNNPGEKNGNLLEDRQKMALEILFLILGTSILPFLGLPIFAYQIYQGGFVFYLALLWFLGFLGLRLYSLGLLKFLGFKTGKLQSYSLAFLALLILLGINLLSALFFKADPSSTQILEQTALGPALFSILLMGIYEELSYRILLQEGIQKLTTSKTLSLGLSILLFSFAHNAQGPGGMLRAALSGLVLSLYWDKEKNLFLLILIHVLHNVIIFTLGRLT